MLLAGLLALVVPALIFLGICAIVWFVIKYLSLPRPIEIVAVVIMSIIAILLLLNLGHVHI